MILGFEKHFIQDGGNIIFSCQNAWSGGDCWRSMQCQNYCQVPPREFLLLTCELFTAQEPFLSTICLGLLTYSQIIWLFLWETFCNVTFCFFFKIPPSVVCGFPDVCIHAHTDLCTVLICFLNKKENEVILTLWSENCFFHFTVFYEYMSEYLNALYYF